MHASECNPQILSVNSLFSHFMNWNLVCIREKFYLVFKIPDVVLYTNFLYIRQPKLILISLSAWLCVKINGVLYIGFQQITVYSTAHKTAEYNPSWN